MKTTLKRSLIVSLFLALGLMVAPLGASAEGEPAACEAAACDAGPKLESTTADVQVEEAAAEASVSPAEANDAVVAEAHRTKVQVVRAERAKNRREWLKFTFDGDDSTLLSKGYDTARGQPTRSRHAENMRKWWRFAFSDTE